MSQKERPKRQNAQPKRLRREVDDLQFLNDFDPEKSTRERRKLTRKVANLSSVNNSIYDEYGRLREHGFKDLCDCMNDNCPGCYFPCPSCGNTKCGPVCRVNRKFVFDYIEFDGKDTHIRNKYYPSKN